MLKLTFRLSIESRPFIKRAMSTELNDVLFENASKAGIITLNRPKALNALNTSMAKKILPVLKAWENEKNMVIIKGAGEKAFCAGGDVKALTVSAKNGDPSLGEEYFKLEYTINHMIGVYKIPYIAIIDGITMGGGLGLSVHGRYRIATERTMIAMPETKIGFFPDVGGSYFLPRLSANIGLYLGLTGDRLKGKDVVQAGIATHYIPSNRLYELEILLLRCSNDTEIYNLLSKFHDPSGEISLKDNIKHINYCFAAGSIEEIYDRLEKVGNEWSKKTIETLNLMSPGSLKITLRALQRGAQLKFGQCLQMEFRLAVNTIQNRPDFIEGVRAVLVDKDNSPKWNPSSIEDVTDEYVESYFKKLPQERELILNESKL